MTRPVRSLWRLLAALLLLATVPAAAILPPPTPPLPEPVELGAEVLERLAQGAGDVVAVLLAVCELHQAGPPLAGEPASALARWGPKPHVGAFELAGDEQHQVNQQFRCEIAAVLSFHADGLGSVRALTDEAGEVTDRWDFTAFGELIGHVGDDPQAYLFAGEALDPNVGWYYNRARWMDPAVGRFGSVDGWKGSGGDPVSLHRYLYVAADPVGKTDPSGNETLGGLLTGFGVQAILVRGAVGALIGAGDAYFRGYDTTSGVLFGLTGGILGPLFPLKFGLALTFYGIGEALWNGDYDAALYRFATFGVGVFLQTRGFTSFKAFKKVFGPAGRGRAWHHIVEQTTGNLARFGAQKVQNPNNIAPLPHGKGTIHARLSGFYSSNQPDITGVPNMTVRQWLSTQPFEAQYQFGLEAMQRFGGPGGPINVWGPFATWTWPATLAPFVEGDGFGQD